MKKFCISLIVFLLCFSANISIIGYSNTIENTNIIYSETSAMATPARPRKTQPIMYPNKYNGYRTGYARPKTRFAKPNKRFSQPQTRYAHKRPEYIYSKEYQNNVVNRHRPGMASKTIQKPITTVVVGNKPNNLAQNKKIACSGIMYYGIQNNCK